MSVEILLIVFFPKPRWPSIASSKLRSAPPKQGSNTVAVVMVFDVTVVVDVLVIVLLVFVTDEAVVVVAVTDDTVVVTEVCEVTVVVTDVIVDDVMDDFVTLDTVNVLFVTEVLVAVIEVAVNVLLVAVTLDVVRDVSVVVKLHCPFGRFMNNLNSNDARAVDTSKVLLIALQS